MVKFIRRFLDNYNFFKFSFVLLALKLTVEKPFFQFSFIMIDMTLIDMMTVDDQTVNYIRLAISFFLIHFLH